MQHWCLISLVGRNGFMFTASDWFSATTSTLVVIYTCLMRVANTMQSAVGRQQISSLACFTVMPALCLLTNTPMLLFCTGVIFQTSVLCGHYCVTLRSTLFIFLSLCSRLMVEYWSKNQQDSPIPLQLLTYQNCARAFLVSYPQWDRKWVVQLLDFFFDFIFQWMERIMVFKPVLPELPSRT